jgi:hypothetical protein
MALRRRSRVLWRLIVAAALAGTIVPAGSVTATTPGTPGPIVYAMYGPGGTQQLWTSMPGGEPVPVPGTEGARSARWSPDGRVLAYDIWGVGIYLINPDGSGKRLLFASPDGEIFSQPVWSPDGTQLAWHVYRGTEPSLIAIADSASGIRETIPTELEDVSDWLADGSFLGGAWRTSDTSRQEEIGLQTPDGTLTYLTDTPTAEEGVPRLSPDGTMITFLSWSAATGHYSLGIMDRDGGNLRTYDKGTQVFWPSWSPTGAEIAIGPTPTGVRLDGIGDHTLTNGGGSGDGLDWATLPGTSPDIIPLAGVRTAALPDPSVRSSSSISSSTIWPVRDGYRDTVRTTLHMWEPTRAIVRIYAPSGARVKQTTYRFDTGVASFTWNGRWSTGAIMRAGRYKLVVSWRDLAGNARTTIHYVTLYHGSR